MKSADPSGMLELRAHLLAAKGQDEQASELYERALSVSAGDPDVVVRYMIVLAATGRSGLLKSIFERFKPILRGDPRALRTVRGTLTGCGWWETAHSIDQDLEKMKLPTDTVADEFSTVDEEQAPEAEVAEAVGFVRTFLRAKKTVIDRTQTMAIPRTDGTSYLFYQFLLDEPIEKVAQLEWDLFGELEAKSLPVESSRGVVFALVGNESQSYAGF